MVNDTRAFFADMDAEQFLAFLKEREFDESDREHYTLCVGTMELLLIAEMYEFCAICRDYIDELRGSYYKDPVSYAQRN